MRHAKLSAVVMLLLVLCGKGSKVPEGAAIRVNGEWISQSEVGYVAELFQQQAAQFSPKAALEGLDEEVRKNAARQLIADRLMLQEAKRRNIGVDQEKFDSAFARFKASVGDAATFTRMLTQAGQTEDGLREQMRQSMMVDSMVRMVLADVDSVGLADCKQYYDENAQRFREREKVRTSQIFFKLDTSMTDEQRAAVRAQAEKALARAKAGEDFASLARALSQGPNAKSGGDIGWFERGDMKPEVDRAIFSLGENEVGGIVESDMGLHIFKKTGEKLSEPQRFHEVQQGIKTTLELKKKNDAVTAVIDRLTASAQIVYADTTLKP